MLNGWQIVVFVAHDYRRPPERYIALWCDAESGELQPSPSVVGPSAAYCRERLEAQLHKARAQAIDPTQKRPALDMRLGQKFAKKIGKTAKRRAVVAAEQQAAAHG